LPETDEFLDDPGGDVAAFPGGGDDEAGFARPAVAGRAAKRAKVIVG
jgi:hypothetical protein